MKFTVASSTTCSGKKPPCIAERMRRAESSSRTYRSTQCIMWKSYSSSWRLDWKAEPLARLEPISTPQDLTPSCSSLSRKIKRRCLASFPSQIQLAANEALTLSTPTSKLEWMALKSTSHCWRLRSASERLIKLRNTHPSEAQSLLRCLKIPSLGTAEPP